MEIDGIMKTIMKTIPDWEIKKTKLKEILYTKGALLNISWYAQNVKNRLDIVIHCSLSGKVKKLEKNYNY
jgi:hypothetical protein